LQPSKSSLILAFDDLLLYAPSFSRQMAELIQLNRGTLVDGQWNIEKKIGEGSFCSVYKCTNKENKQDVPYALKAESLDQKFAFLRKEVIVLSELTTQKMDRHFCKVKTRGRMDNFFYVVLTLVGRSLHDLRMATPAQQLTVATTTSVGIKCLEALEDLHSIEYLYREVSSTNFAVGLPGLGELRKIYLLDLGTARRFVSEDGSIKKQKTPAGFRANAIKFAPLAHHENHELCRKDDIESLMYMLIELIQGALPWSKITDQADIGKMKKDARKEKAQIKLFTSCPKKFLEVFRLADSCKFSDAPDYAKMYKLLNSALDNISGKKELPYEWEAKLEEDNYTEDGESGCSVTDKKPSVSKSVNKPSSDKPSVKKGSSDKVKGKGSSDKVKDKDKGVSKEKVSPGKRSKAKLAADKNPKAKRSNVSKNVHLKSSIK